MDDIGEKILELKQKKRELEKEIKELMNGRSIRCGDVKYFVERYPTGEVKHKVAVISTRCNQRYAWRAMVTADTREECYKGLIKLIEDLVDLNEKMLEDENNATDDDI